MISSNLAALPPPLNPPPQKFAPPASFRCDAGRGDSFLRHSNRADLGDAAKIRRAPAPLLPRPRRVLRMHQPRRSFKRKPLPNEVGPLWSLRLEHPPAGGRTSVSTASSLGKRTAGGRRYDGELGELTFYRRRRPRGDWFGHPISLSFVSRLAPKHLRSAVIERPTTNRPY